MSVGLATVTSHFTSRSSKTAGLRSIATRIAITLIITFMVISSPIFILLSPIQISSASISNSHDTSSYHSSLPISETHSSSTPSVSASLSSSTTTPTIQAALIGPATFRSTDIVNSLTSYEIAFYTRTTGTIKKVDITFPAGTIVGAAGFLERVGITGTATVTKSGTTVSLNLNTPVSVPGGTYVRLEMVDIFNPPTPGSNYKITVTTRDPANAIIDGPSQSPAYDIKRMGGTDIAPDSIVPFVFERTSETITVPPLNYGFAIADCLPSERVVGGGFQQILSTGQANLLQPHHEKKYENGWTVAMFNPESMPLSYYARAECMPALP